MEEKTNRRVVVTGATGMIGRHLVDELLEKGYEVTAFVRDPANDAPTLPKGVRSVEWHASSKEGEWRNEIDGASAVFNLAGAPIAQRWTDSARRKIMESRVDGTRHIVEAIGRAENPPSVLVNASAVGYYGAATTGTVDEDSPAGNDFLAKVCTAWEEEARKAASEGTRVVLVRSGIVLSPEGGALKEMLLPFQFFVGGPVGSGSQPWPWIHIDDEIRLMIYAMENGSMSGPYNGVAPEQITNRDFSEALGSTIDRPSFLHAPEFVMQLMLGEGSVIVTEGQDTVPKRTLQSGFRYTWTGIRDALGDLLGRD